MKCIHRTSHVAAQAILNYGFDLDKFGSGAGAGSGEPAGVFVSPGDGDDFATENRIRSLGMESLVEVEFSPKNLVQFGHEDRIRKFKECRLDFLRERFGISKEDAQAVASFKIRILSSRPDLSKIEEWASSTIGEAEMAKFFSQSLLKQGIDAVAYRDPWQSVDQIIILDPGVISSIKPISAASRHAKPAP